MNKGYNVCHELDFFPYINFKFYKSIIDYSGFFNSKDICTVDTIYMVC